ncbi:hypothetical protein AB5N19_02615 [Seiridium cardinale]
MASDFGVTRPALGQRADIGALYDARTDTFLGCDASLLKGQPSSAILNSSLHRTHEIKCMAKDTYQGKLELLGISYDLAASTLARMAPISGSANYLHFSRRSNKYMEGAVQITMTSEQVNMCLNAQNIREHITSYAFSSGHATHVVTGITSGVSITIGVRFAHKRTHAVPLAPSPRDTKSTEIEFETKLSDLAAYLKTQILAGPNASTFGLRDPSENHEFGTDNFNFAVFSDIEGKEFTPRCTLQNVVHQIQEGRSLVAAGHSQRLMPVAYTIYPLSYVRFVLGIPVGPMRPLEQPTELLLRNFFHACDALLSMEREIKDYNDEVGGARSCSLCPKQVMLHNIHERLESGLSQKSIMLNDYSRILADIRTSKPGSSEALRDLVRTMYTCPNGPKSIRTVITQARQSWSLRKMVASHSGQYLDYRGAKKAISVGSRIYILFFTEAMKHDQSTWNLNLEILQKLLARNPGDYMVALAECAPGDLSFDKSRITFYENRKVRTLDMREAQDHADQSFVRCDPDIMDASKAILPLDRKLVTVACPGPNCDHGQSCEWTCYTCRTPVEYWDQYLYCNCGRAKSSDFVWQCNAQSHGPEFSTYANEDLSANLRALHSYKEINILLLGETGVGKSTFINAFYNYIHFGTLDEAMAHEKLEWIIPSSFSTQYIDNSNPDEPRFVQEDIKVGHDDAEHDGSRGDSATQLASSYCISIGDHIVRLIDTPGVGDVRGIEQDQRNLSNILSTLNQYDRLHGIVILLKPNSARLTLMFRFCVQELLTHLHKDAARNIVWGFTNTRQSDYMPGDSYKPLERLIEQHRSLGLTLSPSTVFCFDSESFRCLAAQKQTGALMSNMEHFHQSWDRSVTEVRRLLGRFTALEPHFVKSTLSLNRARELIHQLTEPMASIADTIQRTIALNKEKIAELSNTRCRGQSLRDALHFQRIEIDTVSLERPRTVCKHPACVETKNVAGVRRPIYKSFCHDPCRLKNVDQEVVGHANLIYCAAFGGENECNRCSHHWQQHMHIRYEQVEKVVTSVDEDVQGQIDANVSDIKLKEEAIRKLEQQIKEAENELQIIRDAAVQFGMFLKKKNSITPYNDAMIAYLDEMIREERQNVEHAKDINVSAPGNEERLRNLERSKLQYAERIKLLSAQMQNSANARLLDEKGVDELITEMYGLRNWGKNLEDMRKMVEWSDAATFREQQFRPRVSRTMQTLAWLANGARAVASIAASGASSAVTRGFGQQSTPDIHAAQGFSGHGKKRSHSQINGDPIRPDGYMTRQKTRRLGDARL